MNCIRRLLPSTALLSVLYILAMCVLFVPRAALAVDAPFECSDTPVSGKSKCTDVIVSPWKYTIEPHSAPGIPGYFSSEAAATAAAYAASLANPGNSWWCAFDQTGIQRDVVAPVFEDGYDISRHDRVIYSVLIENTSNPPCQQLGMGVAVLRYNRTVSCPNLPGHDSWTRIHDSSSTTRPVYCACPWGSSKACALPCCEDAKQSNPIETMSGAKVQAESDYQGTGAFPLQFVRTYRSDLAYNEYLRTDFSPLGIGWSATYFQRLHADWNGPLNSIMVHRPDGRIRMFRHVGSSYMTEANDPDRITAIVSGGVTTGWRYATGADDVEVYDAKGRLLSITNRGGITHTVTYANSTDVNPASVADPWGHQLTFSYAPLAGVPVGKVSTVTLPGGSQITYSYSAPENLTSVSYPNSVTRGYIYDAPDSHGPNLLSGIVDENGLRWATFTYDGGLATSSEHYGGVEKSVFAYYFDNSRNVTDPLGKSRTYNSTVVWGTRRHAATDALSGFPKAVTYDTDGNVSSSKDYANNETVYSYDAARALETSRTEVDGTSLARTITTSWHSTYRLPTLITEPNRTATNTYDSAGNLLTRTITDTSVTPNVSRVWTYTYNSYGQVLSEDGPRTDVLDTTTYTFYSCTTGYQCGQLHTITNALGQVTTFNTYNAHGQPLTITDPNGVVTTISYDSRQRMTSRQIGSETTTLAYWPTGLLKKVTLPDSSFVQYSYDNAHRLKEIEGDNGDRIVYTLDNAGNRTNENVYDPTSVLSRTRSQVFNNLNQLWKQIGAAGTSAVTTTFSYDSNGNESNISAPLSRTSASQYDELNRLKQVTDALSGITQFVYDANDNVTSVTDPRSKVTTYSYNGFGDTTQVVSPDAGTGSRTYDSGGNLKTSTDARGATTTYAYDVLNRVTTAAYKIGSTTDQTVTYSYDTGTNGAGRLAGTSDSKHTLSWLYDAQGRVTSKTQVSIGSTSSSRTVGYAYTNGRLTMLTTPSGQTIGYIYTNGRVTGITLNSGTTILSSVLYEPFGGMRQWTWGNGSLSVRTHDQDGRIAQIDSKEFYTLTYDDAGRITAATNSANSALSWTYGYDSLDRLNSAAATATSFGWAYDANGNRVSQTGSTAVTFTPSTSSNRLMSTTGGLLRTYSFDAAGNTTAYSNLNFGYNNRGRIEWATVGGVSTDYAYNALGQLIRKSTSGVKTHLVYDEAGHLIGEYNAATNALIQETVWMGDIPVATLRPNGSGVDLFYVHTDQLDTPRKVTRPSDNKLRWRWDPKPFGDTAPNQNPESLGTFTYNLRFPGQYYQSETGLHYNHFRNYDPYTGKYVESDPIGLQGGINTYAYVGSRPISAVDPAGLFAVAVSTDWTMVDAMHMPRKPPGEIKLGDTWPTVQTRCDCENDCGKWKLTGCSTKLRIEVSILSGLPPKVEAFAIAKEREHVQDFVEAGVAMTKAGAKLENELRQRTWPSKLDCESQSIDRIHGTMLTIARDYARRTAGRDKSGSHHYRD